MALRLKLGNLHEWTFSPDLHQKAIEFSKTGQLWSPDLHRAQDYSSLIKRIRLEKITEITCPHQCPELDQIRQAIATANLLKTISIKIEPYGINPKIFYSRGNAKRIDVLIYGSLTARFYPFRARLANLLKSNSFSPDSSLHVVHITNKVTPVELATYISQSWLVLCTSEIFEYTSQKYTEICGGGAIPLGTQPPLPSQVIKIPYMVELSPTMSDSEIINIIQQVLSNKISLVYWSSLNSLEIHNLEKNKINKIKKINLEKEKEFEISKNKNIKVNLEKEKKKNVNIDNIKSISTIPKVKLGDVNLWRLTPETINSVLTQSETPEFRCLKRHPEITVIPNSPLTQHYHKVLRDAQGLTHQVTQPLIGLSYSVDKFPVKEDTSHRDIDLIFITSNIQRPQKNFKLVENIFHYFRSYKRVIIGQHCSQLCGSTWDTVEKYEQLSNPDIFLILQRSRILLMTSHFDAGPNVIIEAMLCGCQPIMSLNSGFSILFPDISVCENMSLSTWVKAIKMALKLGPQGPSRMMEAFRQRLQDDKETLYMMLDQYIGFNYPSNI
jgi:hypothetical protein